MQDELVLEQTNRTRLLWDIQIQPEYYRDEQADAGRDCRTRLARPNSQARTNGDREIFIFPVQLTTSRIGNLTRLILTLAMICDDHIYMYIYIILVPLSVFNTQTW